jgi:acyl-CoA thioester hydrolase
VNDPHAHAGAGGRAARSSAYEVRVFYGDTDQMGVAYYANYLRWFEMARNEYLRAAGFPYKRIEADGVRLPVVEAGCKYHSPAHYDDGLRLEAWIVELGRVRVRFEYRIRRAGEAENLATGFTIHASLNADGVPCRVPDSLRAALEHYDASLAR